MARNLLSHLSILLKYDYKDLDMDGGIKYRDNSQTGQQFQFEDGTEDGQANLVWHTNPASELAAGASETWDLLALPQPIFTGQLTIAIAEVRAIVVYNRSETRYKYLLVGGAASQEFDAPFGAIGDRVKVPAGSAWAVSNRLDGWTVASGASKLKVENPGSSSITYDLAILGTTSPSTSSSSSGS